MKNILKYIKENKHYLIFSFFVVSIMCWFGEMGYAYVIKNKSIFPGVLHGPWCPIYGSAFLVLIICHNEKESKLKTLLKIFVTVVVVEYLASYICEIVFKRRVWNYTNYPLDIDGRICLHMSLLFTTTAYIFMNYVEKSMKRFYNKLGSNVIIANIILSFIFVMDLLLTIITKF
ncbi:MAG: putative ABC transporter permease [Bacilli bacterium]|nr:putative ABC transporter permease [Bacilli bacterium]